MPPGKKAPPQQSSLTEWWGSKQKKQTVAATPPDKDKGHPPETDSTTDACPTQSPSERASHFKGVYFERLFDLAAVAPTKRKLTPAVRDSDGSDSGKKCSRVYISGVCFA